VELKENEVEMPGAITMNTRRIAQRSQFHYRIGVHIEKKQKLRTYMRVHLRHKERVEASRGHQPEACDTLGSGL
jgi:hypothetical protein